MKLTKFNSKAELEERMQSLSDLISKETDPLVKLKLIQYRIDHEERLTRRYVPRSPSRF